MAKVKYNLKDIKASDDTLVYLMFRYNGLRLKYSIGLKINPIHWNLKTQRAKETVKFPQHPEFNTHLNKIREEVIGFHKSFILQNKYPTLEEFKEHLDIFLERKIMPVEEPEAKITLYKFIEQFIAEKEKQPRGTTKIFKTFYNHLQNFAKEKGKIELNFENINIDFSQAFINYLYSEPRSHSTNYAAKMLDILRQILDDATERGYNQNLAFRSKKFRISKEDVQNIYLTMDELKKMYDYDFSQNERLERVRDLFIIGSFTGLRFSDFTSIKPEHIKNIGGVDMIQLVTQKTGEPVAIPFHSYVRAIFNKYHGKIPRPLSNQKMNDYIKEVAQIVGIDSLEAIAKSRGGKRVDNTLPKYQLISTHTARRSFASNAFLSGVSPISIMKITSHKTERAFMKYIKISKEENALNMAENAFFKI